ncbi:general stress protein [Sporosarcina sp. P13]|uniref:general stress protein n=1 Tax=Sporosarcina sp. P13 TaxID=2048263 RepID=UPI0013046029|nr:general stress protein [Sporosarcina sp. P13]
MDGINNKTFIGVFYNDSDLLDKIEELKLSGYLDDNIYVIAKNETDITMLRSRTAADVHAAYDSWADRFMGFLTGENHIKQMMYGVGMDDEQINRYYEDVQHGGMLLYVDEGWAFSVYSKDKPFYTNFSSIQDTKQRVRYFDETEPSYGGYEPLKNPAHPEVLAASNKMNAITDYEIPSNTTDSVLANPIIEETPSDFPTS